MSREVQEFHRGLGNVIESESIPDTLPLGQNSPFKCPMGLVAEQISGTAFCVNRAFNRRSWLYRILPSVVQSGYERVLNHPWILKSQLAEPSPLQLRWKPLEGNSQQRIDLFEAMVPLAACGSPYIQAGCSVGVYRYNHFDKRVFFCNSDAETILIPVLGEMNLITEMGAILLKIGDIGVVPRGIRWQADNFGSSCSGYFCENYGEYLRLPELGVIGANGLANPIDFCIPKASFYDEKGSFEVLTKFGSEIFKTQLNFNPLNVVAWRGNYYPYKYSLEHFNTINTVSFDHPDPSIYTVLTSPSPTPGVSNLDFVIFPPRWMVAENTFRPPYFHRNIMSEFMGLIYGSYDAKADIAFAPGCSSLHNCMSPHGPDAITYNQTIEHGPKLSPEKYQNTLAFMFESCRVFVPTKFAMESTILDKDYHQSWLGIKASFDLR